MNPKQTHVREAAPPSAILPFEKYAEGRRSSLLAIKFLSQPARHSPRSITGRTFDTVDQLEAALRDEKYITDRSLATTLFLTLRLRKPLLLEGEAGVGKTEIAKVLSTILDTPLIRLQCYEGLDASAAIYEWDYPRQMLYLRTLEATGGVDHRGGPARSLRRRVPAQATAAAGNRRRARQVAGPA